MRGQYIYPDSSVVAHGNIKQTVTNVARHVQTEPIKTQANHTAPSPILIKLWIVRQTPTEEIRPSYQQTELPEKYVMDNLENNVSLCTYSGTITSLVYSNL